MTTIYLHNLSGLLIDNNDSIITSSAAESPGFQSSPFKCPLLVNTTSLHSSVLAHFKPRSICKYMLVFVLCLKHAAMLLVMLLVMWYIIIHWTRLVVICLLCHCPLGKTSCRQMGGVITFLTMRV